MRDTDSKGAASDGSNPTTTDGGPPEVSRGPGGDRRPLGSGARPPREDDRGQSLNDFALGTGVFVLTVGFVFFLMPTLLAPYYTPTETGNEIRAERSTAVLVDDLLAKGGEHEPNTLNTTCTEAFFDGTDLPNCDYDGGSLDEALGLDSDGNVNVTVGKLGSGTSDIVTVDGTTLARGGSVPPDSNVGVWTRVVYLNGTGRELTVRVW